MYAALLGGIGWWVAGRGRSKRLAERAGKHCGALLTIALGGLTVAFVGIVFLADRWADVDAGSGLFYSPDLDVSLQIVLYTLRVAMGGLAVTFLGAFAPPGRARTAAAAVLALSALAMVVALPAVVVLVFETVPAVRGGHD